MCSAPLRIDVASAFVLTVATKQAAHSVSVAKAISGVRRDVMLGCKRVEMNTKWVTTDMWVDKARANTDERQAIHPPRREGCRKGRGVEAHMVAFRDHD